MAIEPVNTISTNLTAERAARILSENMMLMQKSLLRLSSGLKILSAGDNPAGVAQAAALGNEIARIGAAQINVSNATSFAETQSGFLSNVQETLDRMGELAVLSQDGLTTITQRSDYQAEFTELQAYISNVGTKTFNGIELFSPIGSHVDFAVTIDQNGGQFTMNGLYYNENATNGGIFETFFGSIDISTVGHAAIAQTTVSMASDNIGLFQSRVGATIDRLGRTNEDLVMLGENLTAAQELITKTNIATESVVYSRLQLLADAGTTMLAQANLQQQRLLDLLDFNP